MVDGRHTTDPAYTISCPGAFGSGELKNSIFFGLSGGKTYVMITYVSEENNLKLGDKIRYVWGLKGPIFIL